MNPSHTLRTSLQGRGPTSSLLLACCALLVAPAPGIAETITVDDPESNFAGSPDSCQLGDAIEAANDDMQVGGCSAGNGSDEIKFAAGIETIEVNWDLPEITEDLSIHGWPASPVVIDGEGSRSLLHFGPGISAALFGVVLRGGRGFASAGTSCLRVESSMMVLEDVVIEQCAGTTSANFIQVPDFEMRRVILRDNEPEDGQAVLRFLGSVGTGEDLLVADNTCEATASSCAVVLGNAAGGADVVLRRLTVTGHESQSSTAINIAAANSSLDLEHSTVSGNRITDLLADRAVVRVAGSLTLFNTIIGGNHRVGTSAPPGSIDASAGGAVKTLGFNFIANNNTVSSIFTAGTPNALSDWVGALGSPLDPQLVPLGDRGGWSETMMPLPGSQVIDAGSCASQIADQRGYGHPTLAQRAVDDPGVSTADDGCDIGAVERGADGDMIFSDGFATGDIAAWA